MSRNAVVLPVTGVISGAAFSAKINDATDSMRSLRGGSGLPSTDLVSNEIVVEENTGKVWQRNVANSAWNQIGYANTAFWGMLSLADGGSLAATKTLTLGRDPTSAMESATKQYVDAAAAITGEIKTWPGYVAPSGYKFCDGSAVSRATYATLYGVLCPSLGTVTLTIASPCVITLAAHPFRPGDRFRLFTTGALPTGLTANTDLFVATAGFSTNTFQVSLTRGGSSINTSGSQSGTHTLQAFPWGAGDGSTTFNLPDLRGRAEVGADAMGGSAANNVTAGGAGILAGAMAAFGGAETVTLTTAQIPAHVHPVVGNTNGPVKGGTQSGIVTASAAASSGTYNTGSNTGGGGSHNNMMPMVTVNKIIKT